MQTWAKNNEKREWHNLTIPFINANKRAQGIECAGTQAYCTACSTNNPMNAPAATCIASTPTTATCTPYCGNYEGGGIGGFGASSTGNLKPLTFTCYTCTTGAGNAGKTPTAGVKTVAANAPAAQKQNSSTYLGIGIVAGVVFLGLIVTLIVSKGKKGAPSVKVIRAK